MLSIISLGPRTTDRSRTVVRFRSGTSEQWRRFNPILQEHEPGVDTTNNKVKIGDGSTPWNELKFIKNKQLIEKLSRPI